MFRLNHHDRCVGTFRRTLSCAIVEFQTQAGESAGSGGLFSDANARLVSSHSRPISSVNTGAAPYLFDICQDNSKCKPPGKFSHFSGWSTLLPYTDPSSVYLFRL
jgi:hypothetical protein